MPSLRIDSFFLTQSSFVEDLGKCFAIPHKVREATYSEVLAAEKTLKSKQPLRNPAIDRLLVCSAAMTIMLLDEPGLEVADNVLFETPSWSFGRAESSHFTLMTSPNVHMMYTTTATYAVQRAGQRRAWPSRASKAVMAYTSMPWKAYAVSGIA